MGRKKIEAGVREFFEADPNTNKPSCLVCRKNVPDHLGNMRKHLMRNHDDVFKEIANSVPDEAEPPRKKIKVTVEYDPIELLDAWLNLVIKEGRPFCILDSKSLRVIVKPLFDALDMRIVDSHSVHEEIKIRAEKLRKHITKLLANKMISVKINSTTRHSRRLICINSQTIIKGEIVIQTLSMSEIHRSHTGLNIKEHVLERFNISLDRVYSYTTDNGPNMVCTGELLNYDSDVENADEDTNENTGGRYLDSDDEEEEDANRYSADDEIFNSNLESFRLEGVQVVRCAAHTLALGVDDTLNGSSIKPFIAKCRKLAIHLRIPTNTELIRSMKLKQAKRDNDTRWNSKYDMILSTVNLKNFCKNKKIQIINDSDWKQCDIFLAVFKPVKVATKLLQAKDLCYGDFFKIWLDMTLRVKELTKSSEHAALASKLYANLMELEKLLFEDNDTLLATLYLDPRFRRVLKKIRPEYFDETRARNHLFSLYKQVKKMEQKNREQRLEQRKQQREAVTSGDQSSVPQPSSADPTQSTSSLLSTPSTSSAVPSGSSLVRNDKLLEKYMENLFDEDSSENDDENDLDDDFLAAVASIRNYNDKKPLNTNVIQYWFSKRFSDPTLSKLALILHGVPASQVSVERCFSTLKFILSDYRTNIKSDTLQNLMFLKLNSF